jgi:serine/threonine protein kinase
VPQIVGYLTVSCNDFQRNVLIDDSGRALLCDFGLARVKADISSRSTVTDMIDTTVVAGSRYWMAPERLMGRPLKKPCDIYSFGMTAYEVSSFLEEVKYSGNLIYIYPPDLCR